jgi:hypothetical protein
MSAETSKKNGNFRKFLHLFSLVSNTVQGCPGAFRGVQSVYILQIGHPPQTYFKERIQVAIFRASGSVTCGIGGIGVENSGQCSGLGFLISAIICATL